MENVSTKSEILHDLVELKNKGVKVNMNDSYLNRDSNYTMGNGVFVTGIMNNGSINDNNQELKVNLLKKPSELTVEIYLNSTEDEIKNQISSIKNQVKNIEQTSKSSAIVDFLKEQL